MTNIAMENGPLIHYFPIKTSIYGFSLRKWPSFLVYYIIVKKTHFWTCLSTKSRNFLEAEPACQGIVTIGKLDHTTQYRSEVDTLS